MVARNRGKQGRFVGLTKLLMLRWPERLGSDFGATVSAGGITWKIDDRQYAV
jgi:hypothetical protein